MYNMACITFPERIWSLKSLAFPYNDRFSIFLVWIERCYGSYKDFQNHELSNNYAKGITCGIRPLWRVLFLILILSSFQMIILHFSYADKRGWDSAHPAFSCKEILDSGHSKGDGKYWIDPEKSGNPLKVYCDMSRYGGKRMDFFWDTRTSTGVCLTWCSCYWNVLVLAIRIMFLIKTMAKFSNVICYHQTADLSTNRTVYVSCL